MLEAMGCRTGTWTTSRSTPLCRTWRPWSTPPALIALPCSASRKGAPSRSPTPSDIRKGFARLVLYGGYAQGAAKRARSPAEREQFAAVLTLVRLGWGQENPAFRQIFTSQFVPDGAKEQIDWWNEMQRVSASPENAARFIAVVGDIDVTGLLPKVTVPTLVLHARDEARVPFDAGRRMAAGIPGARFVPLQSRNHLILENEPA